MLLEIASRIYSNPTSFKLCLKTITTTTKNSHRIHLVNTDVQFRMSSVGTSSTKNNNKKNPKKPLKTHKHIHSKPLSIHNMNC